MQGIRKSSQPYRRLVTTCSTLAALIVCCHASAQDGIVIGVMGDVERPNVYEFPSGPVTLSNIIHEAGWTSQSRAHVRVVRRGRVAWGGLYLNDPGMDFSELQNGDLVVVATGERMWAARNRREVSLASGSAIQIAFLNLLDRPVIVQSPADVRTVQEATARLGHGVDALSGVISIAGSNRYPTEREADRELVELDIIVFNPRAVHRDVLPAGLIAAVPISVAGNSATNAVFPPSPDSADSVGDFAETTSTGDPLQYDLSDPLPIRADSSIGIRGVPPGPSSPRRFSGSTDPGETGLDNYVPISQPNETEIPEPIEPEPLSVPQPLIPVDGSAAAPVAELAGSSGATESGSPPIDTATITGIVVMIGVLVVMAVAAFRRDPRTEAARTLQDLVRQTEQKQTQEQETWTRHDRPAPIASEPPIRPPSQVPSQPAVPREPTGSVTASYTNRRQILEQMIHDDIEMVQEEIEVPERLEFYGSPTGQRRMRIDPPQTKLRGPHVARARKRQAAAVSAPSAEFESDTSDETPIATESTSRMLERALNRVQGGTSR